MEVGPAVDAPETAPPVDLLEAFADVEVTIFGLTGTFTALGEKCPIDLSDPRITVEAKNEFVVKAANEAGLEVDAKYEGIFSQIAEQHGLERKFTIARPEKPAADGKEVVSEHIKTAVADRRQDARATKVTMERPATARPNRDVNLARIQENQRLAGMVALNELTQQSVQAEGHPKSDSAEKQIKVAVAPLAEVVAAVQNPQMQELAALKPRAERQLAAPTETDSFHRPSSELLELPSVVSTVVPAKEVSGVFPLAEEASGIPEDVAVEAFPFAPTETASAQDLQEQQELVVAWQEELTKEPLDIYEDFTQSLSAFIRGYEAGADMDEESPPADALLLNADLQPEACPPVLLSVLEGLIEIDESKKEDVALTLREIAGAVHGMHILEANGAETVTKEKVEERLVALCESLLNKLGIDHDQAMLRQFVEVMQHQEFSPRLLNNSQAVELDLENVGTHEAKYFKKLVSNGFSKARWRLARALGNFALSPAYTPTVV